MTGCYLGSSGPLDVNTTLLYSTLRNAPRKGTFALTRRSRADPDHFTLLIVPHTKQEPISLRMPHWALYICLLLVVASLGGLALLVRDYAVARSQLEVLRQDRQVEVDRQRAMRETILAQDVQVRSLAARQSGSTNLLSMDRLIGEVRHLVGLDRLAAAANVSTTITATVTAITATVTATTTTGEHSRR